MEAKLLLVVIMVLSVNVMNAQINMKVEPVALMMKENGNFPNNPGLPVLHYRKVFDLGDSPEPASIVEKVFYNNNWRGSWRNGVYDFHHYHSTAHEALGVFGGWAEVQLGGPGSNVIRIEKGDLVVLPAGMVHSRIDAGDGFAVVGAYPDGQTWDMNYGSAGEFQKGMENILKVPLPEKDPVFGKKGKMFVFWK